MIDFYVEGEDVLSALSGVLAMPHAEYVGLAIGPNSDFGQLTVEAGHSAFALTAGNVHPVGRGGPWKGQPKITWRGTGYGSTGFIGAPGASDLSSVVRLHVLGYESYCELAAGGGHRAPGRPWMYLNKGAGATASWRCSFHGRMHGMFVVAATAAVTMDIYGLLVPDDEIATNFPGDYAPLLVGEAVPAVATLAAPTYHVGGTDHAEPWDTLRFRFSGANASEIYLQGTVGGEWR